MDWPLVLAGPILRRVTPRLVSVWIALRDPRKVRLRVWQGARSDDSGSDLFTTDAPLHEDDADTVRIGDNLHLALVTVALGEGDASLRPGEIYAYNLIFERSGGDADLKSEGLLENKPIQDKAHRPHVPLGYARNTLPTFALPPEDLNAVRLAHGSNRKVHGGGADALVFLDKLIERSLTGDGAPPRPHQLFLTGNQVYGDDVALPLLPRLTHDGQDLISGGDNAHAERLPVGANLHVANLRNFPAGRRRDLVRRPTGDDDEVRITSATADCHLLSFGEYCALYLYSWSSAVWPEKLAEYSDLTTAPNPPQAIDGRLTPKPHLDDLESRFQDEREAATRFRASLPQVRRVLANVPTYMVCGQHDVTADLNLNQLWRDRMLTNPLGRTVLRNGMLAYALFQAWGNDPEAFSNQPNQQLFSHLSGLFPGSAHGPNETKAGALETLFGLDRSDISEPDETEMGWDYALDGPQYRVLALDTFTQRGFEGTYVPPQPLSEFALEKQIPELPPPTGAHVTFVLSTAPVLGLPVVEEFFTPVLNRLHDISERLLPEDSAFVIEAPNPQTWAFNASSFEALLKRLAPYGRVVFLSGETRHAMSSLLHYWQRTGAADPVEGDAYDQRFEQSAIFTQLASSALNDQNDPPDRFLFSTPLAQFFFGNVNRILDPSLDEEPADGEPLPDNHAARFLLGASRARIERLGWDANEPDPVTVENARVPSVHRLRLRRNPVLLTPLGWPVGTSVERLPDWAWRFTLKGDRRQDSAAVDRREDGERPPVIRPPDLFPEDPDEPNRDVSPDLDGYRRVARRHAAMFRKSNPRLLMFTSNVALVRFTGAPGTDLTVHHDLLTIQPDITTPQNAEDCMVHSIVLEPEGAPGDDEPERQPVPRIVPAAAEVFA